MTRRALTGGRCQCMECGLYFTGTREFDRHRAGNYARPGQWQGTRRCLAVVELKARRWRQDESGNWMQWRPERAPAGVEAHNASPPLGQRGEP